MMPMAMGRKALTMEKVEILYRTAIVGNVLLQFMPTRRYTADHACAICEFFANSQLNFEFILDSADELVSATPAVPAPSASPVPLAIVVYDAPGFAGHSLRIDHAVPDLAALKFDDKMASFEIQGAGDWMLCENRNYGGRCARGIAKAEDLKVLQLAGRVSSLYPVPAAAATPAPVAKP